MTEYIILGFLMGSEMSGYDLKQSMAKYTSNFFDASFGSIYPALKRMEAQGSINSREVVEGGKYKKLYSIKATGKEIFMEWLQKPIDFSKTKTDYLVNIYFYRYLPKERAIANLNALIKAVEPILKGLMEGDKIINKNYDVNQYIYEYSTMLFGIGYYQLMIDWSRNLLKKLESI